MYLFKIPVHCKAKTVGVSLSEECCYTWDAQNKKLVGTEDHVGKARDVLGRVQGPRNCLWWTTSGELPRWSPGVERF